MRTLAFICGVLILATFEITGQELTEKGLLVSIPEQPGAVIITSSRAPGIPIPARAQTNAPVSALRFRPAPGGGFEFDTGILRGVLRAGDKSMGLTSLSHVPSGKRLDSSNGLLSHYRVFTKGLRYGGGAWDWPSHAKLRPDGAVEVEWPGAAERPFDLRATYRWYAKDLIEVETTVVAKTVLQGFESFLASYFSESFTNAAVWAAQAVDARKGGRFAQVLQTEGDWQMFPRDPAALSILRDGRWRLPPNPVDWTIRPEFGLPLAFRRDQASGLTVALLSRPSDCFAIASPHQTEGHRSLYLSFFGRDLAAGQSASAKAWIWISVRPTEDQIWQKCQEVQAPGG